MLNQVENKEVICFVLLFKEKLIIRGYLHEDLYGQKACGWAFTHLPSNSIIYITYIITIRYNRI